jgi:hypothetical protein
MIVTRIERNDAAAIAHLEARGQHCPVVNGIANAGWLVMDRGDVRGAVALIPSLDGEDVEMLADGGWTVPSAKQIMDIVFNEFAHDRLSARCPSTSRKNIRVLERMGFKVEGIKRCAGGDIVQLGMLRNECRLLKRN